MLRVLIVSAAALFRQGLRNILSETARVSVVDAVGDLPTALARIQALHPEIIVLDYDQSNTDGAVDSLLAQDGITRLVVLSLRDNRLAIYNRDVVPNPNRDQLLNAVLTGAAHGLREQGSRRWRLS